MKKRLLIFVVLSLLILGGVGYRLALSRNNKDKNKGYERVTVEIGDLKEVVPADGTIRPKVEVEVKSKAPGIVKAIYKEEGDPVKEGEIIVELDKEDLLSQIRQARANLEASIAQLKLVERSQSPLEKAQRQAALEQAKINLENAEKRMKRFAELKEQGYVTEEEYQEVVKAYELAKAQYDSVSLQIQIANKGGTKEEIAVAKAAVVRNRAILQNSEEQLKNATIRAPISGVILSRPVEIGSAVASGTTGQSGGTLVATIGDLSEMYLEAFIDESDVGKVTPGMNANITVDAYPGRTFLGKLHKIAPKATVNQNVSTFQVQIQILSESRVESDERQGGWHKVAADPNGKMTSRQDSEGKRGGGNQSEAEWKKDGPNSGSKTDPDVKHPSEKQKGIRNSPSEEEITRPKEKIFLRAGLTASAKILVRQFKGVFLIPVEAVQRKRDRTYVFIETPRVRDERDVKVGYTDGFKIIILEGLTEGEAVLIPEKPAEGQTPRRFRGF